MVAKEKETSPPSLQRITSSEAAAAARNFANATKTIQSSRSHDSSAECDLINPNLIPKSVRKSLIDLHRKSILNLAHKSMSGFSGDSSQNGVRRVSCGRNVLLKSYSGNQASNLNLSITPSFLKNLNIGRRSFLATTNVFTQRKNKNEIKMHVVDNYV